jgi:hypothetical protein
MMFLTTNLNGTDENTKTNKQLLIDLGIYVQQTGANTKILKRAPHPKYY